MNKKDMNILREISVLEIEKAVEEIFTESNYILPDDIRISLDKALKIEKSSICRTALEDIVENISVAKELNVPICQDTGMAVIFVEIGQDVHLIDGNLNEAINRGVSNAYINGFLRLSVVKDPLRRINTNNNTPAVIHTEIVPGDKVTLTAAPKGFGSENMSQIKMFNPSATKQDILNFIFSVVVAAGSNPCPPVIVGVGIGGDFEKSAILSKKALTRSIEESNKDQFYADMEKEALEMINSSGIGAQGFGGDITALAVNIETFPTHIAGLPVAVNIGCHVTRHKTVTL